MNRKYKYLAKNTVLFTISTFGSKLLSFLLMPLYTSVLSTGAYGVADIISTYAVLCVYIFTLDISAAVLRFAIEDNENKPQVLTVGFRVGFWGSVIFSVCVMICFYFRVFSWDTYCYLFLALIVITSGLSGILNNYMRAIDKVSGVAISGILSTAVTLVSNILFLVVFKIGIIGYLLSMVLSNFSAIIYGLAVIKPWNVCTRKSSGISKKTISMVKYSIPLMFNGISWWINSSLDRTILLVVKGAEQNGLYAASARISAIINTCLTVFLQAWGLSAIKEYDKEDKEGFYSKTYSVLNALLICVCSLIILFNIPLTVILFDDTYFDAWKSSSALVLSGLFSGMSGFVGGVFSAVKDSKGFAITTVFGVVINIIFNILLIPAYGISGAAWATALSFAMVFFSRLIMTRKYINWKIRLGRDILCYVILIFQICAEHMDKHMYIVQVLLFLSLIFLNRENMKDIFNLIKTKLKRRNDL